MALTLEERKSIKSMLPYGSQAEIAQKLGVSRISVYQYLAGYRNSNRIEKAVVDRFEEEKNKQKALREKIYG
ncbi:hypothetical protein [Bacteroides uniformis]|jgi:predicted transcriptional regulator|uniref:hypothetical protein n=1 Tax=Bacteroides uniformis TaxID=820 RepID=UPI0011C10426|nr:hypothetical protein [Bacteroides uniformis]DAL33161.1 MAG TPA_asm: ECF sigma factor [Bacteriophage sp.]